MEVAANQYKMLVEGRTWKATEASDDQFVAVMAEKASLKKLNTTYKSAKTGNKSNGEESSSAPWKSIAPAEGLPQKKTVGSKTFIWCYHHKYCGCHEPSTCFKTKKVTAEPLIELLPAQNAAVLQLTAIMACLWEIQNRFVASGWLVIFLISTAGHFQRRCPGAEQH